MIMIESLNSEIRELKTKNEKMQKKYEKCMEKLKIEKKKTKKHQKDNTCIFRIKNNKNINYFNKSPINQRRCKKQIQDLLKNADDHVHGIGNCFLSLAIISQYRLT
jgi:hypothetical protein